MNKQQTSETLMEAKHSQTVDNKKNCLDSQPNYHEDKNVLKYKLGTNGQRDQLRANQTYRIVSLTTDKYSISIHSIMRITHMHTYFVFPKSVHRIKSKLLVSHC